MMKKAVIIVSFGTAVERARQEEIEAVEHYLRQQVPNCPMVSAYTSPTIRKILEKRGIQIPSLEEAMEFINDDELLEITPKNIRIRKKTLDTETRLKRKARGLE